MVSLCFFLDYPLENPRVFVIGNPLANEVNIPPKDDKEFIFVSTPLNNDFVSSMKLYLQQCIVYIKILLIKPVQRMRLKRSKSLLLREYEKLKKQW